MSFGTDLPKVSHTEEAKLHRNAKQTTTTNISKNCSCLVEVKKVKLRVVSCMYGKIYPGDIITAPKHRLWIPDGSINHRSELKSHN